ncbi:hypothetical protein M0811_09820 [Anaeramoeba ignava]|uniref:PAS domain-containing protein n=1 Tax=Anaeramoeba ignava TaxID=1746090 RepID=A0A9Q0R9I5_ANAIG|nr:hypothetical protein M0811_09820 [Anaeramoeba ignava]|eukprot:Anaeramoba_ignava/a14441_10.p1 GENE.a14441_10~~a14441_10.p1  ORF type:complete len:314 (+),score=134.38 a14441_10:30-944(+)
MGNSKNTLSISKNLQKKYPKSIQESRLPIILVDCTTHIYATNNSFCKLLGYEEPESLNQIPISSISAKYQPLSKNKSESAIVFVNDQSLINDQAIFHFPWVLKNSKNQKVYVLAYLSLIEFDGNFLGQIIIRTPILKKKQTGNKKQINLSNKIEPNQKFQIYSQKIITEEIDKIQKKIENLKKPELPEQYLLQKIENIQSSFQQFFIQQEEIEKVFQEQKKIQNQNENQLQNFLQNELEKRKNFISQEQKKLEEEMEKNRKVKILYKKIMTEIGQNDELSKKLSIYSQNIGNEFEKTESSSKEF